MNNNQNIAVAQIKGNNLAEGLTATAYFYPVNGGTLVEIEALNMPLDQSHPYAIHIHEGNTCTNGEFLGAGVHYNPTNENHPMHAGDLPPLFSNNGYSYMSVFTNKFTPEEIIGKTVIIHARGDDFISQPSGGSGARIACGVIQKYTS